MKYVGFLLHAYQPSWQFPEIVKKAVETCYNPIFSYLLKEGNGGVRFTVNINYSLLEQLEKAGYHELLVKIKKCVSLGKIDLTGSGAYHPILSLIPPEEAERQIILNEKGVERILGKFLKNGFFPPELAFSKEIVPIIKKTDYRWAITDDTPFSTKHHFAPFDFIPTVEGLPVFLRSTRWSKRIALEKAPEGKKYSAEQIVNWMNHDLAKWFHSKDGYVILAMDMETFGLHLPGYVSFLKEFVATIEKKREMRLVFISEILSHFPTREIEVPSGSWSTEPEDIYQNNLYPLWKCKFNEAHKALWRLVDLTYSSLNKENSETRDLMDRGFNSCQFWWLGRGNWDPNIAFQTIPILLKIIKKDQPENLQQAEKIISELERITKTKISRP